MSRDQRPGRVKLIADAAPQAPARRASDLARADLDGASPAAAPAATPSPTGSGRRAMLWSALFIAACIAGAAGVALLPMLGAR